VNLQAFLGGRNTVTLVVDDAPSDVTPLLLSRLEKAGHRAVLFVIGDNVAGREAILVDAVQRGFALGNHSFSHPRFSSLGLEAARAEILQTEQVIDAVYIEAGVRRPGKWFRFPYLDTGDAMHGAFQALLDEQGFQRPGAVGERLGGNDATRIDWPTTVNTRDWSEPTEDAFRLSLKRASPGDVIEFHDKTYTVERYGGALVEELAGLSLSAVVPGMAVGVFHEARGARAMLTRDAPAEALIKSAEPPRTIIDAGGPGEASDLLALWTHRDLLYMLALRDVKLRYQHTAVGAAWALLQPLAIMLVLTGFASVVGVTTGKVPYPLYVIGGLVPWTYFNHAFMSTTNSLVAHQGVIGKIYFPRLIIPVAAALAGAIDFLVAALLLPVFMLAYGAHPGWSLLALPAFVIMTLAAAFALGLWLAVLNVRYRDVINALPFVIQLMFFATPIAYSSNAVPEPWRTFVGLNPMVGVVDGFRWALLGDAAGGLHLSMLVSLASIIALLAGGLWFFRWREPAFADEL
jgi:lipopolysaccharide transport system permease protein